MKQLIFRTSNHIKIKITVALPAFNSKKIIWLALESLIRQKLNLNIYWELIICEEYAESIDIVKNYSNALKKANCAKCTYIIIDPKKQGKFKDVYLLIEKWVLMAICANITSDIYVLMACDIYCHPYRLQTHYNHFKDKNCIISTQPIGPFYNILTNDIFIYDGFLLSDVKVRHLNMAFKLQYMKNIRIKDIRKHIDTYIQNEIIRQLGNKFDNEKNVFYDISDNWKFGFDTDGYNNISFDRRKLYHTDKQIINEILNNINDRKNIPIRHLKCLFNVCWCLPLFDNVKKYYQYDGLSKFIPDKIINKLLKMRN